MEQVVFIKPIIALRTLQLYYHNCHLLAKGSSFIADHNMFSDFYSTVEGNFDSLSEYMIATLSNQAYDTAVIADVVAQELSSLSSNYNSIEEMLGAGLQLESRLQNSLIELNAQASLGLQNLIGDVAQASDTRNYKIQQRLK